MTRTTSSYPAAPARDYPVSEAVISDDSLYRYVLSRRWNDGPVMPWTGLNPSTADADADGPVIRRMCRFARREGCTGICVLNLYALRNARPGVLRVHPDPAGPDNDKWLAGLGELAKIARACEDEGKVVPAVAAWGAHPLAAARVPRVLELLAGIPLACLGTTKSGAPGHPLYVRSSIPLIPWRQA